MRPFQSRDRSNKQDTKWMYGMGILFIIMAAIIALRNLYIYSTEISVGFYLDNYINGSLTNEKFVIAMLIVGGMLLYYGKFKKKVDHFGI